MLVVLILNLKLKVPKAVVLFAPNNTFITSLLLKEPAGIVAVKTTVSATVAVIAVCEVWTFL